MSAFHGLDTAAAEETAAMLDASSRRIEALRTRLGVRVGATGWVGGDAEAFRTRWAGNAAALERTAVLLAAIASELRRQAAEQDRTSDAAGSGEAGTDGAAGGAAAASGLSVPAPVTADPGQTWPWADGFSWDGFGTDLRQGAARLVGDAIGWGIESGSDLTTDLFERWGMPTSGLDQAGLDAQHAVQLLEDWAAGESVPTVTQLGAAGLVLGGSTAAAFTEVISGQDNLFFDARPGGHITGVQEVVPTTPQDLGDLLVANHATVFPDPDGGAVDEGRIRIQEVTGADGQTRFIVQVPPSESAGPGALTSYGPQGNSRDWASNLRLIAGQDVAAMHDVHAALEAAGVPAGSELLMVGHSQGGIVNAHLAADPGFNNDSGDPGTYRVTDLFSIGSPVESVATLPGTDSVNVVHGLGLDAIEIGGADLPISPAGDIVPALDLDGMRVDGTRLADPHHVEVVLDGVDLLGETDGATFGDRVDDFWAANHGNVPPPDAPSVPDADGWYWTSVTESVAQDPTGDLARLQERLTGPYLGDGAEVVDEFVVSFDRNVVPSAPPFE